MRKTLTSLGRRCFVVGLGLMLFVAACAILARPSAHAQVGNAVCNSTGATNPCVACGTYQCLPSMQGYKWGVCVDSNMTCYTALSFCTGYNCQSPPTRISGTNCSTFQFPFSSCM